MSISKRVSNAFARMIAGDPEEALFQICAAIEETAKREGRPKGRKGYKSWVADNVPIVTVIGIGPALAGLRVGYSHPELPVSADGTHSIEDIIYHVVRCGLYHSASLPNDVLITENKIGRDDTGTLLIPKGLVLGLIVAVVASPANAKGKMVPGRFISLNGSEFHLNNYWGKRDQLLKEFIATRSKA